MTRQQNLKLKRGKAFSNEIKQHNYIETHNPFLVFLERKWKDKGEILYDILCFY